jgi:hypothetical protein
VAERDFEAALQRMQALPFVRPGASRIRVEHFKG